VTDGMLGKLTRWLRMLGHDVEYSRSLEDEELIERAKAEQRVLLTRDRGLYQRAMTMGLAAFLVECSTEANKLAELARRFNISLELDVAVSRCPKCNSRIRTVSKEDVLNSIPAGTATYYDEFWRCPGCGQIYWQGSHWKRIEETLKDAEESLQRL
jgi:uncharacterized protein with PIN domain